MARHETYLSRVAQVFNQKVNLNAVCIPSGLGTWESLWNGLPRIEIDAIHD